jgi:hypothetical protein
VARALADRAASVGTNHVLLTWFLVTQGLADYREGRFANAVETLQRALQHAGDNVICTANAHFVLGMAMHRLNQPDQARAALRTGSDIVQRTLPGPAAPDLGPGWHDVLIAHILWDEAKALIGSGPGPKEPAGSAP